MNKAILYTFMFLVVISFAIAVNIEFQPDSVNGTETNLVNGDSGPYGASTSFSIVGSATFWQNGLMNWTWACDSLPAGATITNSTLQMNISAVNLGYTTIKAYPVNTTWVEATENCAYAGNCGLDVANQTWNIFPEDNSAATVGQYNFTINSTYFDKLCKDDMGTYDKGFIWIHPAAVDDGIFMRSSDYATAIARPKLYLTYTTTGFPLITYVYPTADETYNDYDGWINFTTNEDTNCTVGGSDWVQNTTISNSTEFYYNNWDYASFEGANTVDFNCTDSDWNNVTSSISFNIDTTEPTLISTFDGNGTIAVYNLTFQNNYSDETKLFSVNITAQDFSFSLGSINTGTYSFNGTISLENYSVGIHYMNTTYCDAHTLNEISVYDYVITPIIDKLTFEFDEEEYSIEPKSWTHFGGVEVNKLKDKYTIKFERDKGYETTEEIFIVKSTNKISIIGDDKYTGWLVIEGINKWIDFETAEGYKATVKRINDYEVEVTSRGSLFQSTGDLNCVDETFSFNTIKTEHNFTSPVNELEETTITLIINKTGTNITSFDGNLIRGGTIYATEKANSTNYINLSTTFNATSFGLESSVEFYFNYTLNGNHLISSNSSQTVHQIYISSCGTTTNTTALNFTYYDLLTSASMNSKMVGYFQIYTINPSLYRNYSFNFSSAPSHTICIHPPSTVYYADFITQFESSGYSTINLIDYNETLQNTTSVYPVYFLSSANSTPVTIHVTDDVEEPIQNILVEAWYFDLANSSYKKAETKLTNTEGEGVFNLLYSTGFYKFVLYDNTVLKKETDRFQITTLDIYFTLLEQASSGLARWLDVREFETTFDFNNATKTITLSWGIIPTVIETVYMDVVYTNNTVLSSQSSETPTSSVSYVFPVAMQNDTYNVIAYVIDTDGSQYTTGIKSIDFKLSLYELDPQESLIIAFLLMASIALISLFSPIGGIIGAVLGIMLVSFFGLIPMMAPEIYGIIAFAIVLIVVMMKRSSQ